MAAQARTKVCVRLPQKLVERVRTAVSEGWASTQTEAFESGLNRWLEEIATEQFRQAMADAARDPLFLEDIREVQRDFAEADAEMDAITWQGDDEEAS